MKLSALITTLVLCLSTCAMSPAFAYDGPPPWCGKHSQRGHCGRCGYTARVALGVNDPAANLASWWFGYGSPAGGPCIGCIAVAKHHVARIVGNQNGRWIFADDRGTHPMSLAWVQSYRRWAMDEKRLRHILAEELEKAEGLPPQSAAHIEQVRKGLLSPGLQAALNAMKRAVEEDRDPLA